MKNDVIERALESHRRLEGQIRACLKETYLAAERALERARERQAAGAGAVQAEVERIASLRSAVEALRRKEEPAP